MTPKELIDLRRDTDLMFQMRGGSKEKEIKEEDGIRDFALATIVAIKDIKQGEEFSYENSWPKRPGIGEIKARDHSKLIGKRSKNNIKSGAHISKSDY